MCRGPGVRVRAACRVFGGDAGVVGVDAVALDGVRCWRVRSSWSQALMRDAMSVPVYENLYISEKCRKYNSPTRHPTVCLQHNQSHDAQISPRCYLCNAKSVEVFTRPRPVATSAFFQTARLNRNDVSSAPVPTLVSRSTTIGQIGHLGEGCQDVLRNVGVPSTPHTAAAKLALLRDSTSPAASCSRCRSR